LRRQKKVSKEQAAQLPLLPALLDFVGVFGLIPTKSAVLSAANGT